MVNITKSFVIMTAGLQQARLPSSIVYNSAYFYTCFIFISFLTFISSDVFQNTICVPTAAEFLRGLESVFLLPDIHHTRGLGSRRMLF